MCRFSLRVTSCDERKLPIIQKAAKTLISNIPHRFPLSEISIASAILDPSVQHSEEIDDWLNEHNMTRAALLEKVRNDLGIDCIATSPTSPAEQKQLSNNQYKVHQGTARIKLVRRLIAMRQTTISEVEDELRKYKMEIEPIDDILDYWKSHETVFPNLPSIAKVLLCKPATSAKSESSFSVAGSLIRQKRSSIDPTRVEKVLFLHDNYDIFKQI